MGQDDIIGHMRTDRAPHDAATHLHLPLSCDNLLPGAASPVSHRDIRLPALPAGAAKN